MRAIATKTQGVALIEEDLKTSSLNVAEVFGKQHKHVLRDIEKLDCSKDFTESNFGLSDYKDPTGRTLKKHLMSKDGFIFLAMGYTGKKAAQFREANFRFSSYIMDWQGN